MPVIQPTLWDNLALESGYRFLAELDFEEAAIQFEEAFNGPGDKQPVSKAIASVQYWKPRVDTLSLHNIAPDTIKSLSDDFISYHFTAQLTGFKKALLIRLVDVMMNENCLGLREMEMIFDELLKVNEFQKAACLIERVMEIHPEKQYLFYFLAQALWLNGDSARAYGNYIKALLYYPDEAFINRIENEKLKALARSCGMVMTPAYAWLREAMPFITPANDITPFNEAHQHAVTAYYLLQQSEESLKRNDLKSSVRYRKELKKISPELYEEYFALLRQRKR